MMGIDIDASSCSRSCSARRLAGAGGVLQSLAFRRRVAIGFIVG